MPAVRGPVYLTRESAWHVAGQEIDRGTKSYKTNGKVLYGNVGADRRRGTREFGERYYNHCGCTVEEIAGDWSPTVEEQRFVDLYQEAPELCDEQGLPHTVSNITNAMRDLGQDVINYAHAPENERRKPGHGPKTKTGISGGGDDGGDPPPSPVGDFNERERKLVDYLRARGHVVRRNVFPNPNGRVADSEVDGERVELKGFDTSEPNSSTIRNSVNDSKRRGGQAAFVIFDARGTSLTKEEALRGIRRGLGLGSLVTKIRIVGDTYDIEEGHRG